MRSERIKRSRRSVTRMAASPASAVGTLSLVALGAVASALASAAAGYDLCARRTKDGNVAVAVVSAAASLRGLLDRLVASAASFGFEITPRPRMADRLRWEWIASTGSVTDGRADTRLLLECARVLGDVLTLDVSPLGDAITSRVRLASAEAWSLAAAVDDGARWRPLAPAVAFLSPSRS